MSSIDELINNRKQKHQANGEVYPLASSINDENTFHIINNPFEIWTLGPLFKLFNKEINSLNPEELPSGNCIVHGRIKNLRKSGGIAFLKIEDFSGGIQIILTKKVLGEKFKLISNFDLGDIVEAKGQICRTIAGENSILLSEPLKLLSKALLPPPEKWVGITDRELVYKQRYLDLMSNPESRQRFKDRTKIIKTIRNYLDELDFLEVETSMLQTLNSGANAKPFKTHHNAAEKDLYLRIAPELNLKRLLVGGMDRVYEIGKSFRNEGVSSRHNPEFTMLEFYQAYGNFKDLVLHCKNILNACHHCVQSSKWECDVDFTEIKQITMLEAVENAAYLRFHLCLTDDLSYNNIDSAVGQPQLLNDSLEIIKSNQTYGQKLFQLFELIAEPFLSGDYRNPNTLKSMPVMITQYPAEICPLARKSENDPRFCDRFEFYLNGIEVANGYQELNDPEEQKQRFEEQLIANKKDAMDLDTDYVTALSYGMPPAIGFGLGIDRLCQILTGAQSIKDVILFPSVK